jgi:outer membrane lipoprotein SlyB
MRTRLLAVVLLPALLSMACVSTTTTTRSWGYSSGSGWARYGHVEHIQETLTETRGDPAGGAIAGALIGGLLGSSLGGHRRGSAGGAVVGAFGGAMIGAAASQGSSSSRSYVVGVRFDDGGYERFAYPGYVPFGVGDSVCLTDAGLSRM